MSASGSNFIWKITRLANRKNRKLFKCPRQILRAFGSFFSENSFFLNSDSKGNIEKFKKIFIFSSIFDFFYELIDRSRF